MSLPRLLLTTCLLIHMAAAAAQEVKLTTISPEAQLLGALEQLRLGELDQAYADINALVKREPGFRFAQLLYSDLLLAKAGYSGKNFSDPRVLSLMNEGRVRWRGREKVPDTQVPANLLHVNQRFKHVVLVDLEASRLHVYANEVGGPRKVVDYYAGMGKNGPGKQVEGDARTPIGVYRITEYKDDASLPELYGAGAFPVDYPNRWDKKQGRTGYGIWLHGVPRRVFSRPPRSSEGCVTLANADFDALKQYIEPGLTPVVLGRKLEWVDPATLANNRRAALKMLDRWRNDWQSLDTKAYLAHYSSKFRSSSMGKTAFAAHKRRVNGRKKFVRVAISDVSIYQQPDDDMIVAQFNQDYRSSNYNKLSRKEQFWKKEADGQWRIVLEETIKPLPTTMIAQR